MIDIIVSEVSDFDIDDIVRDTKDTFQVEALRILNEAGSRMRERIISPYLSGAALNRVTGTLQDNIYVTEARANKDGSVEIAVGIGMGMNPKNKVPAHVYGFAWEGIYRLPAQHKSPRPFMFGGGLVGGIVDTQPWLIQELGKIGK